MEYIVGIDLGTTNSEIALVRNGAPEVIPIGDEKLMPSCVAIDEKGGLLVGRIARNQMTLNPEATVLSIKRKMGQNCKVTLKDREFTPEEISACILKELVKQATNYLGQAIEKAVITVPAYFNDDQRKATKNAGILAGLEVVRIINEPTAAALAYESTHETDQKLLVYDLGGGTFDVSIVVVENDVVEVKSSHGDTHLGGDDFDNILIDFIVDEFRQKHQVDLLTDLTAKNRLWLAAEKAKRSLSDNPFAHIREEYIYHDLHLDMEIERSVYEEKIAPLLEKTMNCIHKTLKDAQFLPSAIDTIILAGGATRTPAITQMLTQEFNQEPKLYVNPDLIVSMGAAIQAAVISGAETHSVLVDITPHTFGTSVVGPYQGRISEDVFAPVIQRNTPIPVQKSEVYCTMVDNQDAVDVRIYEGEEPLASKNKFIGNFMVNGLSRVPAGNRILLKLNLDNNGILEVTAEEKDTGLTKTVKMKSTGGRADFDLKTAQKNIITLLDEEKDFQSQDHDFDPAKEDCLKSARTLRKRAEALLESLDDTDAGEIKELLSQTRKAINDNDLESVKDLNESLSDMLFYLED